MGDEMPPGQTSTSAGVAERMQTLLSRAVEEQVAEQHAVSAVLTDLRGQVEALSDAVRRGASHDAVEQVARSVSGVVVDIRTATSLLGQRLDLLTARLDALGARLTSPDVDPQLDSRQRSVGSSPVPKQLQDAVVQALPSHLDVLAEQIAVALAPGLQTAIADAVEAANLGSERRVTAHVDESIFLLAEALLGRRRGHRTVPDPVAPAGSADAATALVVAPDGAGGRPAPDQVDSAGQNEVAEQAQTPFPMLAAPEPEPEPEPEPVPVPVPVRPSVTTSLAPSPTRLPASTMQTTGAEAAPEPTDDAEHRRRPWWRPGSPPPTE